MLRKFILFMVLGPLGASSPCWSRNEIIFSSYTTASILRYNGMTGGYVETLLNGAPGLNSPRGVAFGPDGLLYICDTGFDRVMRYDFQTQTLGIFVPNGTVSNPAAIQFSPDGFAYVLSGSSPRIFRFNASTGALVGTAVATNSSRIAQGTDFLIMPTSGDFLVVGATHTAARFNATTGAFMGHLINPTFDQTIVRSPQRIAYGPDGRLWISSRGLNRITRFDSVTGAKFDDFVDGNGLSQPGRFEFLGGMVYVANGGTQSLLRYDATTGGALGTFLSTASEGITDTRFFTFAEINSTPIANAGPDASVNARSTAVLDGTLSSDHESALSYAWTQTAGTTVTLVNPNSAQPSFLVPEVPSSGGSVQFQLTVSDGSLTAVDSVTLTLVPFDSDNDGLPNSWETANGLNPDDGADAALDLDGDGNSNTNEYVAGTDPRDPASALKIVSFVLTAQGAAITFTSVPGKLYRLDGRNDLDASSSWTTLLDNITSTGSTTTVLDGTAGSFPRRFNRIAARDGSTAPVPIARPAVRETLVPRSGQNWYHQRPPKNNHEPRSQTKRSPFRN